MKKFKLIYEKNGAIYGSYSGKVTANDVLLIERAVLEGSKVPAPRPKGTLVITENGERDVEAYARVDVQVPVEPGPGPEPTGTVDIFENGEHNVARFAIANVQVPIPPAPTGTKYINQNGTYNISGYEYVEVIVGEPLPPTPGGGEVDPEDNAVDFGTETTVLEPTPEDPEVRILAVGEDCSVDEEENTLVLGRVEGNTINLG